MRCLLLVVVEEGRYCDDHIGDGLEQDLLCSFLQLLEYHRRHLFCWQFLFLSSNFYTDKWFAVLALYNFEGPILHVCLHFWIVEFPPNQPFCIENCV